MPLPAPVDLASADQVIAALDAGAHANLAAPCRAGSIDHVRGPGRLIATGDLHDNPVHFQAVVDAAGFDGDAEPAHLTLHELIHGENLLDGMDPSYRVLVRAAALKAANPGHVHVLLANHELSQIAGRGVIKNGVNCVKAFNLAVEYVFADRAGPVLEAVGRFIRSMPLALRCSPANADLDVLCCHSLPGDAEIDRFDAAILERSLNEEDYQPRTGSAHLMTWGRSQSENTLQYLADRWNVSLFLLGHERAETGASALHAIAVVLNSDHARGAFCQLELTGQIRQREALAGVRPIQGSI